MIVARPSITLKRVEGAERRIESFPQDHIGTGAALDPDKRSRGLLDLVEPHQLGRRVDRSRVEIQVGPWGNRLNAPPIRMLI